MTENIIEFEEERAPRLAVLLMGYGSPSSLSDVERFYTNVRRGRKPSEELLDGVYKRYEHIGGGSPFNRIVARLATNLELRIEAEDIEVDVHPGMKNWFPFIDEAVKDIGRKRYGLCVGIALAPHYSSMTTGDYIKVATEARDKSAPKLPLAFVERWGNDEEFIQLTFEHVKEAIGKWSPRRTTVVFTAHSLPERIRTWNDPYESEVRQSAAAVAAKLGVPNWTVAYQSASPTGEPWIGPDLMDVLGEIAEAKDASGNDGKAVRNVVICPIGFVIDNMEILYDIDVVAAARCAELGLKFRRSASLNDDMLLANTLAYHILMKAREIDPAFNTLG
jgi:ferrochelatase